MTTHLTPDELSEIDACIAAKRVPMFWMVEKLHAAAKRNADLVRQFQAAIGSSTPESAAALEKSQRDRIAQLEGELERCRSVGMDGLDREESMTVDLSAAQSGRLIAEQCAKEWRAKAESAEKRAAKLQRDLDDANTTIAALRMEIAAASQLNRERAYALFLADIRGPNPEIATFALMQASKKADEP